MQNSIESYLQSVDAKDSTSQIIEEKRLDGAFKLESDNTNE